MNDDFVLIERQGFVRTMKRTKQPPFDCGLQVEENLPPASERANPPWL
jgi:hypothetical protein